MNENRFTKLFKKYNWEVEELGENSYIAYNNAYFVPFSCVPSTEVLHPCSDKYINGISYLEIDKDVIIASWRNHIESCNYEAIGYYVINDFFNLNSKFMNIATLTFNQYSDFELEQWLEYIHKNMVFISNNSIKNYDPSAYGAIIAIRIYYLNGGTTPYADLAFPNGKYTTIAWTDVQTRKKYASGITGYTLFYDEREKRDFEEWLNK